MGSAGKKIQGVFSNAKPIKAIRDPKTFLNKQFNPTNPANPAAVPDFPETDAGKDALLQRALMDRLKRQMIRGGGIKDTIKTSPLGVTKRGPILKNILRGI